VRAPLRPERIADNSAGTRPYFLDFIWSGERLDLRCGSTQRAPVQNYVIAYGLDPEGMRVRQPISNAALLFAVSIRGCVVNPRNTISL
jgi:hypothetical protein